jgi:hypothetical protein
MTTVVAITIQSLMVRPSPASSAATLTLPTKRRLLDLSPNGSGKMLGQRRVGSKDDKERLSAGFNVHAAVRRAVPPHVAPPDA